jgi:hypothetical protein
MPQRPTDAAGTVGLATLGVELPNALEQPGVGQLASDGDRRSLAWKAEGKAADTAAKRLDRG